MAQVDTSSEALRQLVKQAVGEALEEWRDLLHEVVSEVLEDFGLAAAIQEGRRSSLVDREEVFAVLRGSA